MARKKKQITQVPLQHNYALIAPGFPWSVRCDRISDRGTQWNDFPVESFPTVEEAIDRLPALFDKVGRACFPLGMPEETLNKALRIKIVLFDTLMAGEYEDAPNLTKDEILTEFNKHPSVPIEGLIYFYDTLMAGASTILQGVKEIQQYMQSAAGQELSQMAQQMDCVLQTGTGITVAP